MCLLDNPHVALQEIISDKVTEGITLACFIKQNRFKNIEIPI